MHNNPLNIGYSTCPNDTFIFCELAKHPDISTHLHDVETLNELAFEHKLDVTKLSFHAWVMVKEHYQLLSCGAALGRGCGPLVITRPGRELTPDSVIAVPGRYTTAHLLLRLWKPELNNRIFMGFDRVMDAVESGKADAGVIIHEGRFVYEERGFHCLQDLGTWWEEATGQPIPLGCIAARRSLGPERIAEIENRLKASIQAAFDDPASTSDYVKAHAQELSDDVISEHVKTYVNHFTMDLGEDGRAAVACLEKMVEQGGVIQ